MVGESETVSRAFTAAVNAAIWVGGFLAVFVTIFVVATTSDSISGKVHDRAKVRQVPQRQVSPNSDRNSNAEEPSLGLSPSVAN